MSFKFSLEQQVIINCTINDDCNIVVDAVAGSGKTTAISGICQKNPSKRILVLTYNKRLSSETRERFAKLKVINAEIFTLHGFAYTFYNNDDYTDKIINETIEKDIQIKSTPIQYDLIVLDEFQDFNLPMVHVIVKYIRDVASTYPHYKPRLVVLGDKYQTVYESLKQADNRMLINAPELFNVLGDWKRFSLRTTYRLTDKMCAFFNKAVLRTEFFVSIRRSKRKPQYIITDPFDNKFRQWILDFIRNHAYKPDDIFILAPTIKTGSAPVVKLTNFLSDHGFPIFYSNQFDGNESAEETKNKIATNTFHVCKGRERPLVIVFNFDNSYFEWFAKDEPKEICTSPQYVAMTRGLQDLIVVQDYNKPPLEFLDMEQVYNTCDVTDFKNLSKEKKDGRSYLSVTKLLEYLSFDVINFATNYFTVEEEQTQFYIDMPTTIKCQVEQYSIEENISNLVGTLIPLISEYEITGNVSYLDEMGRMFKKPNIQLGEKLEKTYIKTALGLEASGNGTRHRFKQVHSGWLTGMNIENIVTAFKSACGSEDLQFERKVSFKKPIRGKRLEGRVDVINHKEKTVIECKWVDAITDVHKLQILLYYCMLCKEKKDFLDYKLVLFNFKDGKRYNLKLTGDMIELVDYLVYMKYKTVPKKPYEELKREVFSILDRYYDAKGCTKTRIDTDLSEEEYQCLL